MPYDEEYTKNVHRNNFFQMQLKNSIVSGKHPRN